MAEEITELTGVTTLHEAPDNPNLVIDAAAHDIDACIDQLAATSTKNPGVAKNPAAKGNTTPFPRQIFAFRPREAFTRS